jgi:TatD DNase family protein
MHLIDSHCHLDFEAFDRDRNNILLHCQELDVKDIVIPGVTANTWQRLLTLCQSSTVLHPALGLHPMFMDEHRPEHLRQLAEYITDNHIVAIGEIGLDFYIPSHNKEAQTELFTEQLKIAQTAKLPVLLHVRKAHDQTIHLLKQYPVSGGIIHAFNGSLQHAEHYQQLGFVLGVGGAITHHRATRLRSLFSTLPLSSIVLETDAPDMPLSEMQGQRNSPENIPKILACLADIRNESYRELALATTHNSRQVLNL